MEANRNGGRKWGRKENDFARDALKVGKRFTLSQQTIVFFKQNKRCSSRPTACLQSSIVHTVIYKHTHPFDDLVNSITCNLFCAEIGIYPSFPFLFPTDNEFVTATS